MIRRTSGDLCWLVTQHEHARVSGELARTFGNTHFAAIDPAGPVQQAIRHHDAGWPLHDDQPTLNPAGQPRDVFESDPAAALHIWEESSRRAELLGAYQGLLVSLHGMHLSIHAASASPGKPAKIDVGNLRLRFELNKYQRNEEERQDRLRRQLGLRVDRPLKYGLAMDQGDPAEQQLTFDFALLELCDLLSLAVLCESPPTWRTQMPTVPGTSSATEIELKRLDTFRLRIRPWILRAPVVDVTVSAKRVPAKFASEEAFQAAYREAPAETITCRFES
jgi:hypothetical protein